MRTQVAQRAKHGLLICGWAATAAFYNAKTWTTCVSSSHAHLYTHKVIERRNIYSMSTKWSIILRVVVGVISWLFTLFYSEKENCKYSSNFWYFLHCGVAMNRFQIFPCKCYIFPYAMQLFLNNLAYFTLWQCDWPMLRRTLFSDYNWLWVTIYCLHCAM